MRGKKANSSKRKRVHQDPKLQRRNCSEMKTEVIGSSNKKSLVTLAMYNPDSEWMPHYRKLGKWNWRWHSCSKYLKFWTCNFYSNAKVNYSVVSVLCDWIYTRAIISDEKKKSRFQFTVAPKDESLNTGLDPQHIKRIKSSGQLILLRYVHTCLSVYTHAFF